MKFSERNGIHTHPVRYPLSVEVSSPRIMSTCGAQLFQVQVFKREFFELDFSEKSTVLDTARLIL
jgi:hypothetical protein